MSDSFSVDQSPPRLLLDNFSNLSTYHKTLFIKNFVFQLTKLELSVMIKFVEQRKNEGIGDLFSQEMKENAENHFLETHDDLEAHSNNADEEQNDAPIQFKRTKSFFGKKFKPYTCELCSKTFKWNKDLLVHLQTNHVGESLVNDHAGETLFTSADCPKVFQRSMSLKLPKKHTENKTHLYKCDKCSKSFYEAGNLKQHKLTHNDGNLKKHPQLFNCDHCERTFSLSTYLKEHLYKCHDIPRVSSKDLEDYHSIKIDNVGTKLPVSKSLARLSNVIGFS